jgi:ribonuclease D
MDCAMIKTPSFAWQLASILPHMPRLYIKNREDLELAITYLNHAPVIGVDTEGNSLHSYRERVSLIQVSGNDRDFIIDPMAFSDFSALGKLFSRTDVLKVFHATDYDIVVLKRDFGFQISPIFDTCLAARVCGFRNFSLAHLLKHYFDVSLDKRYQKVDWSIRPLPENWLEYAALDTHYLPQLHHLLRNELEAKGRLDRVEEECQFLMQREWTGKAFQPNDYLRIKGAGKLAVQAQRVARSLAVARDMMAQRLNKPVFKVLSDPDLLLLSTKQPKSDRDLATLFPRDSHPIRRRAAFWLSAIREGCDDRSPLPTLTHRTGRPFSAVQQTLFGQLKAWRDSQAEREGVEPAMILTNQMLRELILTYSSNGKVDPARWPIATQDLDHVPLLRRWQVKQYGHALINELRLSHTKTDL